jgi:hypothetical protein
MLFVTTVRLSLHAAMLVQRGAIAGPQQPLAATYGDGGYPARMRRRTAMGDGSEAGYQIAAGTQNCRAIEPRGAVAPYHVAPYYRCRAWGVDRCNRSTGARW